MRSHHLLRRIRCVLLSVAVGVWLIPTACVRAQDGAVAQPSQHAKRAVIATFLDGKRPKAERLAAAKTIGRVNAQDSAAFLAVGANSAEDDAIRWEALKRHRYDQQYLETVLKILEEPNNGGEELDATLVKDLSRRQTFEPPPEIRKRIVSAWRDLLSDPREKVRINAYWVLVGNHDTTTVNLIADGLRKNQPPVPLRDAIHMLYLDGSVNHIGVLRPYLENADPMVQAYAVRALAVDPQSRPKIVELARNAKTPVQVRVSALDALAREDDKFAEYALPLIEDAKSDAKVRQAAMDAFAGRMNYGTVSPANQVRFAQAVEKLAADKALTGEDAAKIRQSAQQLHENLQKTFPEVQKQYEKD